MSFARSFNGKKYQKLINFPSEVNPPLKNNTFFLRTFAILLLSVREIYCHAIYELFNIDYLGPWI